MGNAASGLGSALLGTAFPFLKPDEPSNAPEEFVIVPPMITLDRQEINRMAFSSYDWCGLIRPAGPQHAALRSGAGLSGVTASADHCAPSALPPSAQQAPATPTRTPSVQGAPQARALRATHRVPAAGRRGAPQRRAALQRSPPLHSQPLCPRHPPQGLAPLPVRDQRRWRAANRGGPHRAGAPHARRPALVPRIRRRRQPGAPPHTLPDTSQQHSTRT